VLLEPRFQIQIERKEQNSDVDKTDSPPKVNSEKSKPAKTDGCHTNAAGPDNSRMQWWFSERQCKLRVAMLALLDTLITMGARSIPLRHLRSVA
jgi:hypothetical protein